MSVQLPLSFLTPTSSWKPPTDLPEWNNYKRVSIDLETRDDQLRILGVGCRRGGYIVGIALSFEGGPTMYLPIRHDGGGNMDIGRVMGWMKEQCAKFTGIVVGANLSYDLDYLMEVGIHFPNVKWFRDIQIADPLLNELEYSYSLDAIAKRRIGKGKDESMLIEAAASYGCKKPSDTKKWLWKLPAQFVGPYAEEDARLPLLILSQQERQIEEEELWRVFDLESKVLPVLVKMRRRGVRVHQGRLEAIEQFSLTEEANALEQVFRETSVRINVGDTFKAEILAHALKAIGVTCPITPKSGKPSVDKALLASIQHPIGQHLRRARQMAQLRSMFVNSVREHMVNGRIHCTFNQLRKTSDENDDDSEGARYGRLSCSDPNMQQQPARDEEIGPMWRAIYLPEEGSMWGAKDYSQQEPRWLIHWAVVAGRYGWISEKAYKAAQEAAQRYKDDPSTDNHRMMAEMAGIERKPAKELFLGKIYGMGGPKLCGKLNLPTERFWNAKREKWIIIAGREGQALMDRFDEKVPFAKEMAQAAEKRAKEQGFIRTSFGRKCRFPVDEVGNFDWTHKALNRLIQGSSGDQTKEAIVQLDEAGHFIQLQVHDEVDGSYDSEIKAKEAASIMETCVPMELPSKVDLEMGPSWGESM